MSSDIPRFAEHIAKCPEGTEYRKSPKPLASALPPAVTAPPNVESWPQLPIKPPAFGTLIKDGT